ncbi:DMT family transporter [Bacillus sp. Xin]|uniref:DMT family transporter n=1 Tax=unclassified Bacillus (in: firmicutes) TaxID=185979 RepID=UPI00157226A4|nr:MULTISPECIES: DMT family transporter [unclassified Bacillus (in: firmicutes)]MBC6975337.1 DMT family transporter [Bacillus sp. Xin]NSW37580.1 DMT family transporter [Bacillus sp. Xin1]
MPYFYVFLLLLTSLLWGGNFVVGKSLVGHASPMTLTSLRWMIAVLCLFPIVWFKEKKLFPPRTAILPLLLMGITGVVLFNIFQFLALEHTSATNVGLISTLNAISIALFSSLFLKEKINGLQILSMILSFFGVLLVLSKGHIALLFSLHFNSGDLWMIAAVCIWGIYSVCSKWATKTTSPMMATLYSGIFGVIILLPFNIPNFTVSHINASFITSLLYTGLVSTVVCMVFWNIGVQKLGATTSGIFLNFNPIFTAMLAFLFLGEELTWVQILGTAIVVTGCYLFSHFKTATVQPSTNLARSH